MKILLLLLAAPLAIALSMFSMDAAAAAGNASVIEIVTFRLKSGVSAEEFAPIDKQVEQQHVSKQPGFISRESAVGPLHPLATVPSSCQAFPMQLDSFSFMRDRALEPLHRSRGVAPYRPLGTT